MEAPTTTSRLRPGIRILLYASLALNMLVIGVVAGAFLMGGPKRDGPQARDPIAPYTRAFDEDQRKDMRRMVRKALRDSQPEIRDALIIDYRAALSILRAEAFDRAEWTALVAAQSQRAHGVRSKGQDVVAEFLSNMSPDERKAYADRLEKEIQRFQKRLKGRP